MSNLVFADAAEVADLVLLAKSKGISPAGLREAAAHVQPGEDVMAAVDRMGLRQASLPVPRSDLHLMINEAVALGAADAAAVVGAVMRRTSGRANPAEVAGLADAALRGVLLIPRNGIPTQLVISGGQTGADRAALDASLAVGMPIGGYLPKGRLTEDGPLPNCYEGMTETGTADYGERTALNVKHSSATLVVSLVGMPLTGGTAKTLKLCKHHDKPCLPVPLHPTLPASARMVAQVVSWLRRRKVRVLNVAGPRESKQPGLHAVALEFLTRVLGQEEAVEPQDDDAPEAA